MTPAIQTKYVFTITALVDAVTLAGDVGFGVRRIIPIIGGKVSGEAVNGKVLPLGADFQFVRPNELIELEAKYAFQTDDGATVYVERASASGRSSSWKSSSAARRSIRR